MGYILVVDDEPNICLLLRDFLERAGFEVATAHNGVEALRSIRDRRPDILIADAMMPVMDGFELLSIIRRDPVLADLRVIMLTARAETVAHMTNPRRDFEFLDKPFHPDELVRRIRHPVTDAK